MICAKILRLPALAYINKKSRIFRLLPRGLYQSRVSGALGAINCAKMSAQRARRVAIGARFSYLTFVVRHMIWSSRATGWPNAPVWHWFGIRLACHPTPMWCKSVPNIPTLRVPPPPPPGGAGPNTNLAHLQGLLAPTRRLHSPYMAPTSTYKVGPFWRTFFTYVPGKKKCTKKVPETIF